jgi:hypothetical protein
MWARWFSETTKGVFLDLLVRFTTTFFRFAHIFFISAASKFESSQRCSYFEIGAVLWVSRIWAFMKYFQMAGAVLEQRGHAIGTFEHGEDGVDSAATP